MLHISLHQMFFYLDPGSGSFVIQMLVAGLLGASLAVTIFFKKIKSFFSNYAASSENIKENVKKGNELK